MASFDGQLSSSTPDSLSKQDTRKLSVGTADSVPQARMREVDSSAHDVFRSTGQSSSTTATSSRGSRNSSSSSGSRNNSNSSNSSRDMGPLWCGLCRQVLESPRMLPQCHDSFCEKCLEKEADRQGGSSLCCPTCDAVVNLPPEGVQGFKENRYITEKQLKEERDRNKPGAANIFCDIHKDAELSLFCYADDCKQPICLFCKAVEHDGHKVSYLPEAADNDKKKLLASSARLETSIQTLRNALKQAEGHRTDAKEKAEKIKDLINSDFEMLVSRIRHQRDQVLQDVDKMMQDVDSDLTNDEIKVLKHLNALMKLKNQVSGALDSTNHVEVVWVAKQVSEAEGSARQLEAVMQSLPTKTWSPSLDRDAGALSDELLKAFFGSPVRVELPSKAPAEKILPLHLCEAPDGCNEIHFVHITQNDKVHAVFGGTAPGVQIKQLIEVDTDGIQMYRLAVHAKRWPAFDRGISTLLQIESDPSVPGTHVIYANSRPGWSLSHTFKPPKTVLRENLSGQKRPLDFKMTGFEIGLPISFDVNNTGKCCVLINEKQVDCNGNRNKSAFRQGTFSNGHIRPRTIELFSHRHICHQLEHEQSYVPRQQPFRPTAVSFYSRQGQPEVLLIADLATDTIHMVAVERQFGQRPGTVFKLLRHVGAGSPNLLRPTALDTRYNTIAIGCQNGWILTCKLLPDNDETQKKRNQGGDEEDNEEDASDGSCMLGVENMSTSTIDTCMLDVDNMSTSTIDTF